MKRRTLAVSFGRNKGSLRALAASLLFLAWTGTGTPALAALGTEDVQIYRQALRAADGGRLDEAERIARQARENLPEKLIRWMDLTRPETDASWEELNRFLKDNPTWPNLAAIRRNAETRMPALPWKEVRTWFEAHPPLTTIGFTRYVDALMETGASDKAIDLVRKRYVSGSFGAVEEKDFRQRYVALLRPHDHWARLDRLLWDGDGVTAKRMMPLVDPGHQALALARLALADMAPGVEAALRKVPAKLQADPGLLYERTRWRRRKDQDAGALEILIKPPKDMGRPEAWWTERHIMARRLMEQGQYGRAYQLAAAHGTGDGLAFAQAEFLAGWLSLRFLKKPEQALKHFETLFRGTSSPISRSRGAYWAGRALDAMGNQERARQWYEAAMSYNSTFYGMLAVDRLGLAAGAAPVTETAVAPEAERAFERNELVRLAKMLHRIEGSDSRRLELFLRRLSGTALSADNFRLTAALAAELDRPDLAVWTARQALQDGFVVYTAGYPLLERGVAAKPEAGLIHAITRQESSFDAGAVSPAGARGLMQLMPATAQHVAKGLGLKHSHDRLTSDPTYNLQLGASFLQDLVDRYNGSYVLAIAAYNAGPGRVSGWLTSFGDPRDPGVDPVDWIETIPIYETRNYVQRVLENLHLYRARLKQSPVPMTVDLKRGADGNG